jgi:cardiolipin synthase
MTEPIASLLSPGLSEGEHWLILAVQSVAFVAAVAIILRLAHEKRAPANIFAWSLFLLFLPVLGVPFYLLLGGRKIRRLVAEKTRIRHMAAAWSEACAVPGSGRVIAGNRVRLLPDGVAAYRAVCREIDRARTSIDIATFILGRDAVGRSLVARLTAKARQGVRVRLLIDALGSLGARDAMFRDFRAAGGTVHRFIPLSPFVAKASANLRNHRKIAVFDGKRAMVGGQNMDGRFLAPRSSRALFADLGLVVEGPAVGALLLVFAGDWAFASGEEVPSVVPAEHLTTTPCGESGLEIIPSGPDIEGDFLWERIITLVQEARRSVTIVTPYFIPDEVLLRSLLIRAHNGTHVRIVVPENSNHPIVDFARNRYLRQMAEQGVEILFYRHKMLHAKLILVDDEKAVSGSANIDPRSFFVNFEIGLIHSAPEDIAAFREWLEARILPRCVRFEDSPRSRETRLRLTLENFAHLLTPLL